MGGEEKKRPTGPGLDINLIEEVDAQSESFSQIVVPEDITLRAGLGTESGNNVYQRRSRSWKKDARRSFPRGDNNSTKSQGTCHTTGSHLRKDTWIFNRPGRRASSYPPCRPEISLLELKRSPEFRHSQDSG